MSEWILSVGLLFFGFVVVSVLVASSQRAEQWLAKESDDGIRGAYWRQSTSSALPSFDNSGAFMGSAHGGAEVLFDSIGSRTYVTQRGVVLEAEIIGPNLLRIVGPVGSPKGTPPTPSNPSASPA